MTHLHCEKYTHTDLTYIIMYLWSWQSVSTRESSVTRSSLEVRTCLSFHLISMLLFSILVVLLLLIMLLLLFAKSHIEVKFKTYSFTNGSRRAHRARVSTLSPLTLLTLRSNHSLGAWWTLECCQKMCCEVRLYLKMYAYLSTSASNSSWLSRKCD